MVTAQIKIEGMDKIEQRLKAMGGKNAIKAVKQALRAGAKVTLAAARLTAPKQTGQLARAIKVKAGRTREHYASIMVSVGKKWFTGDQFYAAFVEFGWRHGPRRLGNRRKLIPGEHYLEFSFDESKAAALDTIVETLWALVENLAEGRSIGAAGEASA